MRAFVAMGGGCLGPQPKPTEPEPTVSQLREAYSGWRRAYDAAISAGDERAAAAFHGRAELVWAALADLERKEARAAATNMDTSFVRPILG